MRCRRFERLALMIFLSFMFITELKITIRASKRKKFGTFAEIARDFFHITKIGLHKNEYKKVIDIIKGEP